MNSKYNKCVPAPTHGSYNTKKDAAAQARCVLCPMNFAHTYGLQRQQDKKVHPKMSHAEKVVRVRVTVTVRVAAMSHHSRVVRHPPATE